MKHHKKHGHHEKSLGKSKEKKNQVNRISRQSIHNKTWMEEKTDDKMISKSLTFDFWLISKISLSLLPIPFALFPFYPISVASFLLAFSLFCRRNARFGFYVKFPFRKI